MFCARGLARRSLETPLTARPFPTCIGAVVHFMDGYPRSLEGNGAETSSDECASNSQKAGPLDSAPYSQKAGPIVSAPYIPRLPPPPRLPGTALLIGCVHPNAALRQAFWRQCKPRMAIALRFP